jgi:hypothetical protein
MMMPTAREVESAELVAPSMEAQTSSLSMEPELLSRVQPSFVAMSMNPRSKVNPRFGLRNR